MFGVRTNLVRFNDPCLNFFKKQQPDKQVWQAVASDLSMDSASLAPLRLCEIGLFGIPDLKVLCEAVPQWSPWSPWTR